MVLVLDKQRCNMLELWVLSLGVRYSTSPLVHERRLQTCFLKQNTTKSLMHHERPDQNEARAHASAVRASLGLQGCDVQWMQIPLCTGYDDQDEPVVELKEWPFILPHLLVHDSVVVVTNHMAILRFD